MGVHFAYSLVVVFDLFHDFSLILKFCETILKEKQENIASSNFKIKRLSMVLVKTPQYGDSHFTCECMVCEKPIMKGEKTIVLFDMKKSLQEYTPTFFVHHACINNVPNISDYMSKDIDEFLAFFLPQFKDNRFS